MSSTWIWTGIVCVVEKGLEATETKNFAPSRIEDGMNGSVLIEDMIYGLVGLLGGPKKAPPKKD